MRHAFPIYATAFFFYLRFYFYYSLGNRYCGDHITETLAAAAVPSCADEAAHVGAAHRRPSNGLNRAAGVRAAVDREGNGASRAADAARGRAGVAAAAGMVRVVEADREDEPSEENQAGIEEGASTAEKRIQFNNRRKT